MCRRRLELVGPNRAAVEAMLKVVGFRKVELVSSTPAVCKAGEGPIRGAGNSKFGRMSFHAWK